MDHPAMIVAILLGIHLMDRPPKSFLKRRVKEGFEDIALRGIGRDSRCLIVHQVDSGANENDQTIESNWL
jgi:hypothetical protein